jgi:mono/diheme cytochrome c family protein
LTPRLRRLLFVPALLLLGACNPGAYPIDIFPEMHYQISQRRLEPNRLAPPRESIPTTGRTPTLTFTEAREVQNPVGRSVDTSRRAGTLYAQNCAMCHGATGDGQAVVAQHFQRAGRVAPVDLRGQRAASRTDGELHWILTNGLGGMPPFGSLLSDEERWHLVQFVRETQGR